MQGLQRDSPSLAFGFWPDGGVSSREKLLGKGRRSPCGGTATRFPTPSRRERILDSMGKELGKGRGVDFPAPAVVESCLLGTVKAAVNCGGAQCEVVGEAVKGPRRGTGRKLEEDQDVLGFQHRITVSQIRSIFQNLEYGTASCDQFDVGKCIEPASAGPAALVAGQRLVIALPRV